MLILLLFAGKYDCNTCVCQNGRWKCDYEDCTSATEYEPPRPKQVLDERSRQYPCEAGSQGILDCNDCSCSGGRWRCSENSCNTQSRTPITLHAGNKYQPCKNGALGKLDCNTCTCNNNRWKCTQHGCTPVMVH